MCTYVYIAVVFNEIEYSLMLNCDKLCFFSVHSLLRILYFKIKQMDRVYFAYNSYRVKLTQGSPIHPSTHSFGPRQLANEPPSLLRSIGYLANTKVRSEWSVCE